MADDSLFRFDDKMPYKYSHSDQKEMCQLIGLIPL